VLLVSGDMIVFETNISLVISAYEKTLFLTLHCQITLHWLHYRFTLLWCFEPTFWEIQLSI